MKQCMCYYTTTGVHIRCRQSLCGRRTLQLDQHRIANLALGSNSDVRLTLAPKSLKLLLHSITHQSVTSLSVIGPILCLWPAPYFSFCRNTRLYVGVAQHINTLQRPMTSSTHCILGRQSGGDDDDDDDAPAAATERTQSAVKSPLVSCTA